MRIFTGLAVSVLISAAQARSEVVVRDIDVAGVPGLEAPGAAWDRVPSQSFRVFEGLDVPLIAVRGTDQSWYLDGDRLLEWTQAFPTANALAETVRLRDGTVIGGPSPNHLRYIQRPGEAGFAPLEEADDFYWSDHVEGADIVFGKVSRMGPLMVLEDRRFVPSSVPEKGQTGQGEFLPW